MGSDVIITATRPWNSRVKRPGDPCFCGALAAVGSVERLDVRTGVVDPLTDAGCEVTRRGFHGHSRQLFVHQLLGKWVNKPHSSREKRYITTNYIICHFRLPEWVLFTRSVIPAWFIFFLVNTFIYMLKSVFRPCTALFALLTSLVRANNIICAYDLTENSWTFLWSLYQLISL